MDDPLFRKSRRKPMFSHRGYNALSSFIHEKPPNKKEREVRFAVLLCRVGVASWKRRPAPTPVTGDDGIFALRQDAITYFERLRWRGNPICPRLTCDHPGAGIHHGGSDRPEVYRCPGCGLSFSYRTGTLMSGSHLEPHVWLKGMWFVAGQRAFIQERALAHVISATEKTAREFMRRIAVQPKPAPVRYNRNWPRFNQFFPEDDPRRGQAPWPDLRSARRRGQFVPDPFLPEKPTKVPV